MSFRAASTCVGAASGSVSRYSAAAPTTCGVAIEVPLNVSVASSAAMPADVTFTPGAQMSRQPPRLEKSASMSLSSVAPTVVAAGVLAGE